jgi:hypothetical protein
MRAQTGAAHIERQQIASLIFNGQCLMAMCGRAGSAVMDDLYRTRRSWDVNSVAACSGTDIGITSASLSVSFLLHIA